MLKKIAVFNSKGGVGKSTVSTQIAHGLAKLGFKTLLINTDGQNDSISFLGIGPDQFNKTLFDLIDKRYPAKLAECIINTRENLDVLPSANIDIIDLEFSREPRIDLVIEEKLLDVNEMGYDYIIIDCGPLKSKINTAVLYYIDHIIMPVQLEEAAVRGAGNVYAYLKELRIDPVKVAMVIPNMYDRRTNHSQICLDVLKSTFDSELLTEPILERSKIKDAGLNGKSVFEYDDETAMLFFKILERLVKKIG